MNQTQLAACAVIYGIGVALTFDEFGMWLHLGGSYWQRARFDAVVALLGIFGLIGFMPRCTSNRGKRTALSWQVFDWPQQPRSAEAPTKCRGYNLS